MPRCRAGAFGALSAESVCCCLGSDHGSICMQVYGVVDLSKMQRERLWTEPAAQRCDCRMLKRRVRLSGDDVSDEHAVCAKVGRSCRKKVARSRQAG